MTEDLDMLSPDYWLRRVAEMRAATSQAADPESQAVLLRIMKLYEQQAAQAGRRVTEAQ